MYLASLHLNDFRSCEDVTIEFCSDLTVLVGENNGGKSNVIDALRLLTLPLNGRREVYAEESDLRRGAESFDLQAIYRGLSPAQKGLLIQAVPDPTKDAAIFGLRHEQRMPRSKTMIYAGKWKTAEPEPGSTELVRHVYLPALRDAQRALASSHAARIVTLLRHFLGAGLKTKEERRAAELEFVKVFKRSERPHPALHDINAQIDTSLKELTAGVRPQDARLAFADEQLLDVARDLRFKLADSGADLNEISASGLGYSNLLYMATVIVELAKAREADLTLLLVEEPEAHLHPQLQMLVLDFLLSQAQASVQRNTDPGGPEGQVQVIVTTHSPNLTAWVAPEHLVVLRSQRYLVPPKKPEKLESDSNANLEPVFLHRTSCIPIAKLGLKPKQLNKISRYLDVTKSALLFGDRVILVEGIAEALLLPVIARHVVLAGDTEAWKRFQGTALVPIDGVDFKPYVEILLKSYNGARVCDLVVIVTDADPHLTGDREYDLDSLAEKLQCAAALQVFTNDTTLEQELFTSTNQSTLRQAYLDLHPRSAEVWAKEIELLSETDRAKAFYRLFEKSRTRKGDFAQHLAELIQEGKPFKPPAYLEGAIRAVSSKPAPPSPLTTNSSPSPVGATETVAHHRSRSHRAGT